MKKEFYPYVFWLLIPIVIFFIWNTDLYLNKGIPDVKTPSALLLPILLFVFGFPHLEAVTLANMNKGKEVLIYSKIVFYLSILIVLCVIIHMMGSESNFPNLFNLKTINLLVDLFLVANLIFSILVIFLKFKKK